MSVELEGLFWDLEEIISNHGSDTYHDFEGFASTKGLVERAVASLNRNGYKREYGDPEEVLNCVRDLLVHWMFESRDQADYELTDNELDHMCVWLRTRSLPVAGGSGLMRRRPRCLSTCRTQTTILRSRSYG